MKISEAEPTTTTHLNRMKDNMTTTHHTITKMHEMKLSGMSQAYEEQLSAPDSYNLSFDERLGLLIDREATERENRRLTTRLRFARLKQSACIEDIDFRHPRGLDKATIIGISQGDWIERHQNILITGPTGTGKSYLGCAFAHKAIVRGHSALYIRLPRLLEDIGIAHGDGRYLKLLNQLSKTEVLVIDDFGLVNLNLQQAHDILEVLDDRYQAKSTIVTSQLPVDKFYDIMPDPTIADALLDRLVHNAYTIAMSGESMRKKQSKRGNS